MIILMIAHRGGAAHHPPGEGRRGSRDPSTGGHCYVCVYVCICIYIERERDSSIKHIYI